MHFKKKSDQKDYSTNAKKKLKVIRISENSEESEEEEVDEFDGFLEGDTTKNANFIKPKVSNLNNALQYIKKETSEGQYDQYETTSVKNKLKFLRIPDDSDFSEEDGALDEVDDEFEGFLGGDTTKNANFIKPKISNLNNALQYIKTMVVTVVQKHRPREFSTPKYEDPIVTNEDAEYNSDGYEIVEGDQLL